MDEKRDLQKRKPLPNPLTRAAHRKEFRLQVLLPFVLFVLAAAAAVGLMIYYGVGTVERWSQVSTIFLVLFWMVIGLLVLVVVIGLIFVISKLLQLLPPYTRMAQDGIETIKRQVESGANITIQPIIKIRSFLAVIDALRGRR